MFRRWVPSARRRQAFAPPRRRRIVDAVSHNIARRARHGIPRQRLGIEIYHVPEPSIFASVMRAIAIAPPTIQKHIERRIVDAFTRFHPAHTYRAVLLSTELIEAASIASVLHPNWIRDAAIQARYGYVNAHHRHMMYNAMYAPGTPDLDSLRLCALEQLLHVRIVLLEPLHGRYVIVPGAGHGHDFDPAYFILVARWSSGFKHVTYDGQSIFTREDLPMPIRQLARQCLRKVENNYIAPHTRE